jgi:hypothetical protein
MQEYWVGLFMFCICQYHGNHLDSFHEGGNGSKFASKFMFKSFNTNYRAVLEYRYNL